MEDVESRGTNSRLLHDGSSFPFPLNTQKENGVPTPEKKKKKKKSWARPPPETRETRDTRDEPSPSNPPPPSQPPWPSRSASAPAARPPRRRRAPRPTSPRLRFRNSASTSDPLVGVVGGGGGGWWWVVGGGWWVVGGGWWVVGGGWWVVGGGWWVVGGGWVVGALDRLTRHSTSSTSDFRFRLERTARVGAGGSWGGRFGVGVGGLEMESGFGVGEGGLDVLVSGRDGSILLPQNKECSRGGGGSHWLFGTGVGLAKTGLPVFRSPEIFAGPQNGEMGS